MCLSITYMSNHFVTAATRNSRIHVCLTWVTSWARCFKHLNRCCNWIGLSHPGQKQRLTPKSSFPAIDSTFISSIPVTWGCRIHRLHLGRRIKLPQRVPWIYHKTIWSRNSSLWVLGDVVYPFIAILPRSTLTRSSSTW